MSGTAPPPRIGKYAGQSTAPLRKPPKVRKAPKPVKQKPMMQPGLINR
jgi:hypothetical protein